MHPNPNKQLFLGIDLGSSFVKFALIDQNQHLIKQFKLPHQQMKIISQHEGWAEQDPEQWWNYVKQGIGAIFQDQNINKNQIKGLGISYQMHGLVMIDQKFNRIHNSIIWCDSRATKIGEQLFQKIQTAGAIKRILNHPSNFTISKLVWIKENKPQIFQKIWKVILPGDYIIMKLTGRVQTTKQALSQGVFWDYKKDQISNQILQIASIKSSIFPELTENFTFQCSTSIQINKLFGLKSSISIYYRCGDQPNNAFSLNVLQPGEIAVTGGTSGVIYAISQKLQSQEYLKYNSFLHVNHSIDHPRLGKLLCINGCGIIYQWLKKNFFSHHTYQQMNKQAGQHRSEGIIIIPFGNGCERMLSNEDTKCHIFNLNFNRHGRGNIMRAAIEGIAFSFIYGANLMKKNQINIQKLKAGKGNMFESQIFCQIISNILNVGIQIYQTNGAQGAAKGALIGYFRQRGLERNNLERKKQKEYKPNLSDREQQLRNYQKWLERLKQIILKKT